MTGVMFIRLFQGEGFQGKFVTTGVRPLGVTLEDLMPRLPSKGGEFFVERATRSLVAVTGGSVQGRVPRTWPMQTALTPRQVSLTGRPLWLRCQWAALLSTQAISLKGAALERVSPLLPRSVSVFYSSLVGIFPEVDSSMVGIFLQLVDKAFRTPRRLQVLRMKPKRLAFQASRSAALEIQSGQKW